MHASSLLEEKLTRHLTADTLLLPSARAQLSEAEAELDAVRNQLLEAERRASHSAEVRGAFLRNRSTASLSVIYLTRLRPELRSQHLSILIPSMSKCWSKSCQRRERTPAVKRRAFASARRSCTKHTSLSGPLLGVRCPGRDKQGAPSLQTIPV